MSVPEWRRVRLRERIVNIDEAITEGRALLKECEAENQTSLTVAVSKDIRHEIDEMSKLKTQLELLLQTTQ